MASFSIVDQMFPKARERRKRRFSATKVSCIVMQHDARTMLTPRVRGASRVFDFPVQGCGYAGNNTAEGTSALFSLSSGADNTAIGFQALFSNTSGTYNSGEGFRALFSNTTGSQNTATGTNALSNNTTAPYNTADGVNSLL